MAVKICIIGAAGRMGKNIAEAVYNNENAEAAGAVDRKGSEALGQNLYEIAGCGKGGPVISDDILESAKNAIAFAKGNPTLKVVIAHAGALDTTVLNEIGLLENVFIDCCPSTFMFESRFSALYSP